MRNFGLPMRPRAKWSDAETFWCWFIICCALGLLIVAVA